MRGGRAEPGDLASTVAAMVRAVRESQAELDHRGRASLQRWSDSGIPPTWLAWGSVRVTATVAWRTAGPGPIAGAGPGVLWVAATRPCHRGAGELSLTLGAVLGELR